MSRNVVRSSLSAAGSIIHKCIYELVNVSNGFHDIISFVIDTQNQYPIYIFRWFRPFYELAFSFNVILHTIHLVIGTYNIALVER
jgi:hypothetical protein